MLKKAFQLRNAPFVILLFAGFYLLFTSLYPSIFFYVSQLNIVQQQNLSDKAITQENYSKIVIPKLGLDEQIYSADEKALDRGIWHKFDTRSNPSTGGNFVLVGHRFNFGFTPGEVKRKSPLFNIHQLQIEDEIEVHWENKKYTYKITEKKQVEPDAIEIEENTNENKLTLYTCTFGGWQDGRVVVVAEPIKVEDI